MKSWGPGKKMPGDCLGVNSVLIDFHIQLFLWILKKLLRTVFIPFALGKIEAQSSEVICSVLNK